MAEYCKDCFKKLNPQVDVHRIVMSREMELCEGCGQLRPCVVRLRKNRFQRWTDDYQTLYYVVFCVADKKKHLNGYLNASKENRITLKITGHCGIEALVWCYKMLKEFEEGVYVPRSHRVRLAVMGDDKRRFHMYERALSRRGWHKEFLYGQWTMVKEVSRE